jgi:hypothetical protein
MGEEMNANNILAEKPEGKRQLGIARHRWVEDNMAVLDELRWNGIDWIDLAEGTD